MQELTREQIDRWKVRFKPEDPNSLSDDDVREAVQNLINLGEYLMELQYKQITNDPDVPSPTFASKTK